MDYRVARTAAQTSPMKQADAAPRRRRHQKQAGKSLSTEQAGTEQPTEQAGAGQFTEQTATRQVTAETILREDQLNKQN